ETTHGNTTSVPTHVEQRPTGGAAPLARDDVELLAGPGSREGRLTRDQAHPLDRRRGGGRNAGGGVEANRIAWPKLELALLPGRRTVIGGEFGDTWPKLPRRRCHGDAGCSCSGGTGTEQRTPTDTARRTVNLKLFGKRRAGEPKLMPTLHRGGKRDGMGCITIPPALEVLGVNRRRLASRKTGDPLMGLVGEARVAVVLRRHVSPPSSSLVRTT